MPSGIAQFRTLKNSMLFKFDYDRKISFFPSEKFTELLNKAGEKVKISGTPNYRCRATYGLTLNIARPKSNLLTYVWAPDLK